MFHYALGIPNPLYRQSLRFQGSLRGALGSLKIAAAIIPGTSMGPQAVNPENRAYGGKPKNKIGK